MKCHLNIGSNTGNSSAIIRKAIKLIEKRVAEPASMRISSPVVSPPWGYESEHFFTNVGVSLTTPLTPTQLLEEITAIHTLLGATPHRNPDGSYRDRNLDIDIIHLGDTIIDTPTLTAPHPRMHLRNFVLTPLAELEPYWLHPLLNKTALELLSDLPTC